MLFLSWYTGNKNEIKNCKNKLNLFEIQKLIASLFNFALHHTLEVYATFVALDF